MSYPTQHTSKLSERTGSSAPGISAGSTTTGASIAGKIPSTGSSSGLGSTPAATSAGHINGQYAFRGFNVPTILSWSNPYETGTLLAEALGLFVVFGSTWTLRYFLKLASLIIGIVSLLEWGSRSISGQRQGLISTYQPSRFLPLSDTMVLDVSRYIANIFSRVTFGIQHLVDARSPKKGLKLAGVFYLTYVLLGFVPLKALVLTAIVLVFSLPPLYLQFKPEVDRAITDLQTHVHGHAKNVHKKVHEVAGPQIAQAKKIFGTRGGFPSTANVSPVGEVPTAGAKPTPFTTGAHSTGAHSTGFTGTPASGSEPVATIKTTTTTTTTQVPDDVFKTFDSVPTLAGNVPIDQEKLASALAADRAKAEGSLNGL